MFRKRDCWLLLLLQIVVFATAKAQPTIDLVKQTIQSDNPAWKIVEGGHNLGGGPESEEGEMLRWKSGRKEVKVYISKVTSVERAKHDFFIGTMTQIPRRMAKVTVDGAAMARSTDQLLITQGSETPQLRPEVTVDFRKGRVVMRVESRDSTVAQRLARRIAEALPAT